MNYKPNEIDWKVGDLVLHDADAKRDHMLMEVIEKRESKDGIIYVTRYKYDRKDKVWKNPKECLHNPEIWGVRIR